MIIEMNESIANSLIANNCKPNANTLCMNFNICLLIDLLLIIIN
jgi:hypothetical protein